MAKKGKGFDAKRSLKLTFFSTFHLPGANLLVPWATSPAGKEKNRMDGWAGAARFLWDDCSWKKTH
jgi:hypothetical protein